jgi:hypothetical protein
MTTPIQPPAELARELFESLLGERPAKPDERFHKDDSWTLAELTAAITARDEAVRREALEEAANVAAGFLTAADISGAIRALAKVPR